MGKRYRDLVSQYSKAKRSARSVINVMASWASDDGVCSKRIDGIAAECGLSLRSVQYAIAALIELGEIEISESGIGRGNTPAYTLKHATFASFTPNKESEKVQDSTEKVQKSEEKVQELNRKGANSANDTIYGSSIDPINQGDISKTTTGAREASPSPSTPVSEPEQPFPKVTRISYAQVLDARAKAIKDALPEEINDPPSKRQLATPTEPTPEAAHVISLTTGEKIFIPGPVWTSAVSAMLEGLGTKALADTGSVTGKAKRTEASFTLETLCKMSEKFRTVGGIKALFESWKKARPNDGAPLPAYLEEHASKYLSGKLRYPGERKEVKRNVPELRIATADLTEWSRANADMEINF